MCVLSKCTIVRTVGRPAYALEVLYGGDRAQNRDKPKATRAIVAASTVVNVSKSCIQCP
jgi:hypothetical protein